MAENVIKKILKDRYPFGIFLIYDAEEIDRDRLPQPGVDTGREVTRFSPAVFAAESISDVEGKDFDSENFDLQRQIFSVGDDQVMGLLYATQIGDYATLVYDSWISDHDRDADREGRMLAALLEAIRQDGQRKHDLIIRIEGMKYAKKYRQLLGEERELIK